MAEIRKHDPDTGNAIAQALRAAMGDAVRPNTPGEAAATPSTPAPDSSAGVSTLNFQIRTRTVALPQDQD